MIFLFIISIYLDICYKFPDKKDRPALVLQGSQVIFLVKIFDRSIIPLSCRKSKKLYRGKAAFL